MWRRRLLNRLSTWQVKSTPLLFQMGTGKLSFFFPWMSRPPLLRPTLVDTYPYTEFLRHQLVWMCLVVSTIGGLSNNDRYVDSQPLSSCEEQGSTTPRPSSSSSSSSSSFDRDTMIDQYLASLMKDQNLIQLPYHMGTTSPTLFHLFGVDRVVVEGAIATLEDTIRAWNEDRAMIVGHPIVYAFQDTSTTTTTTNSSTTTDSDTKIQPPPFPPLIHHPEFTVPWALLETVVDILWEDERIRPGIFSEVIEKQLLMNILSVMSNILMDIVLSASISTHHGTVTMKWHVDIDLFQSYYQDLLKDPDKFRLLVKQSMDSIDFEVVQEQAKLAVAMQRQQSSPQIKDEDRIHAFQQLGQTTTSSMDYTYGLQQRVYDVTFQLMLILFYWFTFDTEARILGRSITQRFVKPEARPSSRVMTPVDIRQ